MIHKNKALNFLYWILTGIFVFLFIFLLVKLFPFYKSFFSFLWQLFAPFLISCLLAYLLYPIVLKIHQHRIPKSIAILFIYIFFFGGIGFSIYWFYPLFIEQLRDFNEHLPQLLQLYESVIYQIYESTSFLPEAVHDKLDQVITKIRNRY
ncbi:AI-2E family transporter [Paracerasibacillus soli]|uniref:AI-2E family transporter n=1 Tax=Paracerasibacillus soli TaxID=480284 RepID=UPI00387E08EB